MFCAEIRNAKQKDRASQKQRSDFLAAPVHMAPPGRQKSEREFCLFGGVFLRPACRAACRGSRFFEACRCLACWLLCPVFRHFSAGVSPPCPQPAGCLLLLRLVWSALPLPAVSPPCALCVRAFFPYLSPFPASLLPLKSLFTCRSGRDGPLLSSEKKVDKDSQKGFAPLNPIPAPCGRSFLLPRCWPAYAALWAANRRLTGKRLKSQGAKLSFSSVSVQRGTPAPFRRSPPFSRCWPA